MCTYTIYSIDNNVTHQPEGNNAHGMLFLSIFENQGRTVVLMQIAHARGVRCPVTFLFVLPAFDEIWNREKRYPAEMGDRYRQKTG